MDGGEGGGEKERESNWSLETHNSAVANLSFEFANFAEAREQKKRGGRGKSERLTTLRLLA